LILSGDQLYRMDFRQMLKTHQDAGAEATIAVLPVAEESTREFGLVRIDPQNRVTGFVEKPKTAEERQPVYTPTEQIERAGIATHGRNYLASMGIYLFNKETLLEMLRTPPLAPDFGKEVFPRSIRSPRIQAPLFDGYWEDLGTVKSYHEASRALAGDPPPFDFHSPEGVIYTRMRFL